MLNFGKMRFRLMYFLLCLLLFSSSCEPEEGPVLMDENGAYGLEDLILDTRWRKPQSSKNTIGLKEVSGAVQCSQWNDGAWVIMDSGDSAKLYLLNIVSGELKLSLYLEGLRNVDWEDMASTVDTGGITYLYVADIGDNVARNLKLDNYSFNEQIQCHDM